MTVFFRLRFALLVLGTTAVAQIPQTAFGLTNKLPTSAVMAALSGTTTSVTSCAPSTTVPSVTICSPTSTSGSPIQISAAAVSSTSVNYMAVWLDGSKVYQISANTVNTTVPAAAGTHRVTVQAKDSAGTLFAKTVYTTVGGSACLPGSTVPSVTICSPTSSSSAPIHVSAATRSNTAVNYVAVWMDGIKMYQANANSVDTSIAASSGTHRIVVQAKDLNGVLFSSVVYTTVSGTATSSTWALSGTISPTASGAGAKVTLSGASSASTTANSSGVYTFTGLPNGTYTVTPTVTGTTFTPTSKTLTINGANITGANFTANLTATSSHSVNLSWKASTSSTVSGYKVYRSTKSGGPYALLNSAPVTSTLYTDLTVASGTTYYYVVTAVESSGTESSYSNQATAVVPTP